MSHEKGLFAADATDIRAFLAFLGLLSLQPPTDTTWKHPQQHHVYSGRRMTNRLDSGQEKFFQKGPNNTSNREDLKSGFFSSIISIHNLKRLADREEARFASPLTAR